MTINKLPDLCDFNWLRFAGSLLTARFMKIQQACDNARVYELRFYRTFPGRLTPLEARGSAMAK